MKAVPGGGGSWYNIRMANNLLQAIASQMEIGAEFSDAYIGFNSGLICRIHEFDEASEYRRLAESGHLSLIPPITSQDLYLWMVEFAETVMEPAHRRRLDASLKGISAVWKFRNVLYHNPALSDLWEKFKNQKLLGLAQDWIDSVPHSSK